MAADHPTSEEAPPLVELKVHGVLPDPNTETQIVILRDEHNREVLPIWVGQAEGHAIEQALKGFNPPRPMSHDLIRDLAQHLRAKISKVVVTDVKNSTFFAAVHLVSQETERVLDARPSDAIALALRSHCPIFVTQDVLKRRSGGNPEAWLERFDAKDLGTIKS